MAKKRKSQRMPCVPKSVKDRFERCAKRLKKQSKYNPWAVCNNSVLAPYKRKSKAYKKCMRKRK
jgi:hypothetical protein